VFTLSVAYPCIGAKFVLRRNYSYHIIQIYIPSILIVILSWVNFWLDCTCVPGRVSLALLTVLTMTTQSSGARSNLPRVSYIKVLTSFIITRVYLLLCLYGVMFNFGCSCGNAQCSLDFDWITICYLC